MNIIDYLRWRGEIPFRISPFNDVDNVILSQISYVNWEGILNYNTIMTLPEAWQKYQDLEEARKMNPNLILMVDEAANSERFKKVRLMYYVREIDAAKEMQFSALTMYLPDNTYYVAFEGTESSVIGWKEDFNMTYMFPIPSQKMAYDYLANLKFRPFSKVRVGGHSKGGNLAIYASVMLENSDRIINVYNNDGPGFSKEFLDSKKYQRIKPKIISLIPHSSVIGQLMNNDIDEKIVLCSTNDLAWQHIVYSWEVDVTQFAEADKTSNESKFFQQALNRWNNEMSTEQKQIFMNTFYETITDLGITEANQIFKYKLTLFKALMNKLKNYDEKTRKIVLDVIKALLQSNVNAFYNTYVEKRLKKYERTLLNENTSSER